MRRRTYLAAASALTLAGCTGSDEADGDTENGSTAEGDDSGGDDDGDVPDDEGDAEDDGSHEGDEDDEDDEGDTVSDDSGDTESDDETAETNETDDESGEDNETDDEPNEDNETDGETVETDDEDGEAESGGEPVEPGTFDNFSELSRWEVLEGSLEASDEAYAGDRAARLESGVRENRVTIARAFDEPRDLRGVVPGIAVESEEMVVPTIQIVDASGDRIDYRRAIKGGLSFMRYNFGEEQVVGNPDLGRAAEIRITLWTGTGEERAFRCDDLHFTPRLETGTVMIQFDDTHDTDYTEGFRILEEYGYPATTFVNPDRVGEDGWLSLVQLEELSAAGWTIGSHTYSHPNLAELDRKEQEAEIVGAADWLAERGFEGLRYFAYPFGQYDEDTVEIVGETHELGFAGGYPVQGHAVNPALCSRIGDPGADRAIEVLERTAEMGGISFLFYHRLEEDSLEAFEATIERLADLESAGDLEVISPRDFEAEFQFPG